MPGVTISAGYGAGGSIIAPAVARQLGLPLLDRAISSHVAAQLRVSVQEAHGGAIRRSRLAPLAGGVLGAGTDCAPPEAIPLLDDAAVFREQAETIMRNALMTGAVILGRAGGAAFRDEPADRQRRDDARRLRGRHRGGLSRSRGCLNSYNRPYGRTSDALGDVRGRQ